MSNLLERYKRELDSQMSFRLNPSTKFFGDSPVETETFACQETNCLCSSVHFVIETETGFNTALIFNFSEKTVSINSNSIETSEEYSKEAIQSFFEKGLTEEDWDNIAACYYSDKHYQCYSDIDKENTDFEFDADFFKDKSLMLPFQDVFPLSSFRFEHEGATYLLLDDHCKNMNCDCTEAHIEIGKLENIYTKKERFKDVAKGFYDYKTKRFEKDFENKKLASTLLKVVREQFSIFDEELKLRAIYAKFLFGEKMRERLAPLLEQKGGNISKPGPSKVGRNEPCPCGSGKKYKKCCLNK